MSILENVVRQLLFLYIDGRREHKMVGMRISALHISVFIITVSQGRASLTCPGMTTPCPPNAVCMDGRQDCQCDSGYIGDVRETVGCGGNCGCPGSLTGDITSHTNYNRGYYPDHLNCWWIVTGVQPSVTIETLALSQDHFLFIDECDDVVCNQNVSTLIQMTGKIRNAVTFTTRSERQYMRLRFTTGSEGGWEGFRVSWKTGGNKGCQACQANTYKVAAGDGTCTLCPPNSLSLSGSATLKDCLCNAGSFQVL